MSDKIGEFWHDLKGAQEQKKSPEVVTRMHYVKCWKNNQMVWRLAEFTCFKYIHKVVQPSSHFINIFISPWKTPFPLVYTHSRFLPDPGKHFLSLWICLFWTFHINEIIWHMTFCGWLLSLSKMFSKFIQIVASINILFLFIAE